MPHVVRRALLHAGRADRRREHPLGVVPVVPGASTRGREDQVVGTELNQVPQPEEMAVRPLRTELKLEALSNAAVGAGSDRSSRTLAGAAC